jgi:molecular chaperone Hsp33
MGQPLSLRAETRYAQAKPRKTDLPHMATDDTLSDDQVQPFHLATAGLSGRLLRLGPALDRILGAHAYPETVSVALGEALALAALFATSLKFDSRFDNGRFILQTKTDGPLGFLVAHFDVPGQLRGYASVKPERTDEVPTSGRIDQAALLGNGYLAMTISPGGDLDSYQGIVPLDGGTLVDAAHTYFKQSEQLPTFIRLAVARHFVGGAWHWRAGGLMLQYVPKVGGDARPLTPAEADAHDASMAGEQDEDWQRARLLAQTVEDHELLDPTLSTDRLLFRLFHEEGVSRSAAVPLVAKCRCSRERLEAFLSTFKPGELADMRTDQGDIAVTCEFCATEYRFPAE